MTIDELIAVLQEYREKYSGDLPVFYNKERYLDYPAHFTVDWMNDTEVVDLDDLDDDEKEDLIQAFIIW